MTLDLYLPFVLACFAVLGTPGPTILLVLAYNLANGRRAVLWSAAGVVLGDTVAATMVIVGLSTVLATIPQLFTVMKWVGVGYLLYLGTKMIRGATAAAAVAEQSAADASAVSGPTMLRHCFAVTALNAKGLVFMSAFLPGFISPDAARLPQLALLGVTFAVLGGTNAIVWGYFASKGQALFKRPSYRFWLNLIGGGFLLLAALLVALTQMS